MITQELFLAGYPRSEINKIYPYPLSTQLRLQQRALIIILYSLNLCQWATKDTAIFYLSHFQDSSLAGFIRRWELRTSANLLWAHSPPFTEGKWRSRFSNQPFNFPLLLNFGKPFYCQKKLKILGQIYIKVREGSAHNIMHKNIGVWGKVLQVTLNLITMVLHTNNWQPCQAETLSLTFI